MKLAQRLLPVTDSVLFLLHCSLAYDPIVCVESIDR